MFVLTKEGALLVNKNELVSHVATSADISRGDATKAVDAIFEGITESLKKGEEIRLTGFGSFVVTARAASEGRNPRTGEKINIAASKQVKFKPGKVLKDDVNGVKAAPAKPATAAKKK